MATGALSSRPSHDQFPYPVSSGCRPPSLSTDLRYVQWLARTSDGGEPHTRDNFTLNEDCRQAPDCGFRSTSAADYHLCAEYRRRSPIPARLPSSIFHEDQRCLEDVGSETRRVFVPFPLSHQNDDDKYEKMFGTNFKLGDYSCEMYQTTNKTEHVRLAADKNHGSRRDLLAAHVIQGDPEKVKCAVSETQLKFIAHDVTKAPPVEDKWSSSPIKGDERFPRFVAATSDIYRPHEKYERVRPTKDMTSSHVLKDELGATDDNRSATMYREAFRRRESVAMNPEDMPRARAERMRATSFNLDDGLTSSRDDKHYRSSMMDEFRPYPNYQPPHATGKHKDSDFMEGDVDECRRTETNNTSTYRTDYRLLHAGRQVQSDDLKKHSFEFGDRQLAKCFYEMSSSEHKPHTVTPRLHQTKTQSDSVPLDYYGPEVLQDGSTYCQSYPRHGCRRMQLNEEYLTDALMNSHLPKWCKSGELITETQASFPSYELDTNKPPIDTRKCQRSNVPIGTLIY